MKSSTPHHIRPYQPEDRLPLIDLFRLNVPTYFDPKEVQDLIDYLDNEPFSHFVVEQSSILLGCAGINVSQEGKMGHVTWIFFHPGSQGKGLGRLVLDHCLQELRQYPQIETIETTTSQLAYQFFARFGFELIETQKDYWGKGLDLYRMIKPLP